MRTVSIQCLLIGALFASSEAVDAQVPAESVEADVSTRNVAIKADFVGAEIVVFGAVENSRQPSAEAGTYDVVIIVEGPPSPVVVRRKANIGGIWVNTSSVRFASPPSYYSVSSTRPIQDVAEAKTLAQHEIGFEHIRMIPLASSLARVSSERELADFRDAVVRLKQRDGLYSQADYGVAFVGRSLFRATMPVPPNVPVGRLATRVFLFRDGLLLGQFKGQVSLQREGLERLLYDGAYKHPLLYGFATVLLAAAAGLGAAFAFRREA